MSRQAWRVTDGIFVEAIWASGRGSSVKMCVALISRAKERTVFGTEEGGQAGRSTRSVPRAATALRRQALCAGGSVCRVCAGRDGCCTRGGRLEEEED